MKVIIDGKPFEVRHNYLHRGTNPRLVLQHKENNHNVNIQLDNNGDQRKGIPHRGYWYTKNSKVLKEVNIILPDDVVNWKNFTIECGSCGHKEKIAAYAVAQHTMGNTIIFTCECGHKINI